MKLNDYAGEVRISSEDAVSFVKAWFKPTDRICISALRSERTGGIDAVAQTMLAKDFIETTDDKNLESCIFDPEDGSRWNVYISVSPVKEDVQLRRRGTKSNVDYVPGVWADIDVQPGGFESQEAVLDWLDSLDLKPTVVCSSGSGGVHAYWRLKWSEQGDEKLVDAWWSYLDDAAGEDRAIDKLVDSTRILRLPGTVRFPKKDEVKNNKIGSVAILRMEDTRYSVEEIRSVSAEATAKKAAIRKQTIERDRERRMSIDEMAKNLISESSTGRWGLMQAISHVEDFVNDYMSWGDILIPHGWKFRREQQDGSKEWARPGQNARSAVTDYQGSPVMSLLSMSAATRMSDLLDAGIPLTKYRVLLRLEYDDNEEKMVLDMVDRMNKHNTLQEEDNVYQNI